MQEQKATLDLNPPLPQPDMNSLYFVDWDKIKSVNELMLIIASLGISFSPHHPAWNSIKHLVDYTNPVNPQVPQQPKQMDMKLPKLKTV